MKAFDLRTKTPDELTGLLADLRKEQFNLRFQKASGQLENTARMKIVRRDIARVLTLMTETRQGRIIPKRKALEAKPVKPAATPKAEVKAPEVKAAPAVKPAKAAQAAKAAKPAKTKTSAKKAAKKKGK